MTDWLFHASLLDWAVRLYWAAAVGQTLFVALWMCLPWWKTAIGRALMTKSFALMLVLDWSIINFHWGPFAHSEGISVALFGLVGLGIWVQLLALAYEVGSSRRNEVVER